MKKDTIQKIAIGVIAATLGMITMAATKRDHRGNRSHERSYSDAPQRGVDWTLKKLKLDDRQREAVEPALKRLHSLKDEGRKLRQQLETELAASWTIESFNRKEVDGVIKSTLQELKRMAESSLEQIDLIHNTLSEDQRRELVRWMDHHPQGFGIGR